MIVSALAWAIKSSFRTYVASIADGVEQLSDEVRLDGGRYRFPAVQADGNVLKFRGWVKLSAYRGVLDVRIADPWVEFHDDGGVISIAHPRVERNADLPRMVLAEFHGTTPITPLVSFDGARLLGDVYQLGAPLDPIHIID